MEHVVERPNTTAMIVSARVAWAEISPLLKPAAERISAKTDIAGFRKGKAPYEAVKAKVGEFTILEHAARSYIEQNLARMLEEVEEKEFKGSNSEPVGEPQTVITKLAPGEDFEFTITRSLLPPIELPDYRAIAKRVLATKRAPDVTAEEVADAIRWLRESRAKLVTVNRGANAGDRVEIDFEASADGQPLEQAGSTRHPLVIGHGAFPPGFEDALVGLRAGEQKAFSVAVPADYRDRTVAGKNLKVSVEMCLVQTREVPEWNDAFAASIGQFESAEAAALSITKGLAQEKEVKERERIRIAMVQAIADAADIRLPDILVTREAERMVAELAHAITATGAKFDEYLGHIKRTEDDLKTEWRGDAQRRVKIALVLREIARRESIKPSEEDIREAARHTAAHRGEDATDLDARALNEYHSGVARNEKVFSFLEHVTDEP